MSRFSCSQPRAHFGFALFAMMAGIGVYAPDASATFCQDRCTTSPFQYCITNAGCSGGGTCVNFGCCDQTEESDSNGECKCGDTLDGNVTLDHDIVCASGDGLIVDTNNEVLDLDGHKIACTGAGGACGVGVKLSATNTVVRGPGTGNKGGRIEGFTEGVTATNSDSGTEARQLTVTDAGLSMTYGIRHVAKVKNNVVSGAAAGIFGGNGIEVGANCDFIEDNIVTDCTRGISIGVYNGGTSCKINHNRAIANDNGFIVYFGNFDPSTSNDNILLNNSVNDYSDTNTSNRLSTTTNVCRLSPAGNACTLAGMDFVP
jgi:hypothetical protein